MSLALQTAPSLPRWDFDRVRVDVGPLVEWVRGAAGLAEPGKDLSHLHEHLSVAEAAALSDHLTRTSCEPLPRQRLHDAVVAVATAMGVDRDLLCRMLVQRVGVVRILMPDDEKAPLPLHADCRLGHSLDERNLWFALTDARDSAALQGIDHAPSAAVLHRRRDSFFADDRDLVLAARPRPVRTGDVLLFTAEHVHGGVVNRTPRTRVSVDIRVVTTARQGRAFTEGPAFVPLQRTEVRGQP